MRHVIFLLSCIVVIAGCSGSTTGVGSSSSSSSSGGGGGGDSDALFNAPPEGSTVTPGSIEGLWAGMLEEGGITFDTRWKLHSSSITLATRCTFRDGRDSATVGVTARARVSETEITFLESKTDETRSGDAFCRVSAKPRSFNACGDVHEGFEENCFRFADMTLTLYGDTPLEKLELVKVSD
jgi:hypothetical protein